MAGTRRGDLAGKLSCLSLTAGHTAVDATPFTRPPSPSMSRKIAASVLCFMVVAAAAAAQPPLRPSGLRIVVTPNEPVLTVGDTLRLRGEARDSAGRPVAGATVRFFGGSMEGTVDTLGLVKVGAPGSLVVNAVASGPDGRPSAPTTVRIRIVAGPPSRVAISGNASRYVAGQQASLGATVYSASNDRRDDRVTWSSSAPAVATVNPLGRLTAVAPGRAAITAAAGTAKATVTVDVVPNNIRRVEIGGVSGPVRTGDVVHLTASAKTAAGQEVRGVSPTWTMAPGGGLIDQDGVFVANGPGDYTVSASFGTASAQFVVVGGGGGVKKKKTQNGRGEK